MAASDYFSAELISVQDGVSHTLTLRAEFKAPITLPSEENAADWNTDPSPSSVSSSCWVPKSQSLMASRPLLPAARRLPSGEKATEWIPRRTPRRLATWRRVAVSQSRTYPSLLAMANM